MTQEEKEEIRQIFSNTMREEEDALISRISQRAKESLGGYVLSKLYVAGLGLATWAYFTLSHK